MHFSRHGMGTCLALALFTICFPNPVFASEGTPDPKAAPPARISTNGTLIITATKSKVWIPPDGAVILSTGNALGNFKPEDMMINTDGVVERQFLDPKNGIPFVTLSALRTGQHTQRSRRNVRIILADIEGRLMEAMQCSVENRDPGVQVKISPSWQNERLKVTLPQRQSMGNLYFYSENGYIGQLSDSNDSASIDCRNMPSGTHTLWCIAETADGVLLPPVKSDVDIKPRYALSYEDTTGGVKVLFEKPEMSLHLKVSRAGGVDTVKTKVYIAGNFVGESDKPTFELVVPLKDVPSGTATLEVIGIGKDAQRYSPETSKFEIKNEIWDAYITGTAAYRTIIANKAEIDHLEQDSEYWYTRAINEPQFTISNQTLIDRTSSTTSGSLTTTYLSTLYTPGHSGEYIANARRDVLQMSQYLLQNGQLFTALKMREWARVCFQNAMHRAGVESRTGSLAKSELNSLDAAQ